MYEVQLNGYTLLATKMKVLRLSLVYFNPTNEISEEIFTNDNFVLRFGPKIISVEIQTDLVTELLTKAKEILDFKEPPPPRENCKGTCYYIEKIRGFLNFEKA